MKAKKLYIIALVLAIVMLIMPISEIRAEEELDVKTSGDYEYYILDDGTACIKKCKGKEKKVIVPEELDGIKVTAIGELAFAFSKKFTEIIIPDGVNSIGDKAFYDCHFTKKIRIPDGVKSIGNEAFTGCNITEIKIPDSVENIGTNPFLRCLKLTDIDISADHPTISIVDNALFYKPEKRLVCYLIASEKSKYEIPDGIESIGSAAFYSCYNLTEITIPDSVQSIGERAFDGCNNLTKINIPEGIKSIENGVFSKCENLTKITIPDSVKSIGDSAFFYCTNLTEINIPDGVQTIGDRVFSRCENIKINIPASVNSIEKYAFEGCDNFKITVAKDSYAEKYCKENKIKYTIEGAFDWLKD